MHRGSLVPHDQNVCTAKFVTHFTHCAILSYQVTFTSPLVNIFLVYIHYVCINVTRGQRQAFSLSRNEALEEKWANRNKKDVGSSA